VAPTLTATITDVGVGVPTTGAQVPRIWLRRSAPTTTAWGSIAGTLQSGDGNNGQWDFLFNPAVVGVPTPVLGEVYEYYVVAADQATNPVNPNIGFNTEYFNNVAVHANNNVNTQTSAMPTPLTVTIQSPMPTTVYVGTGVGTPMYPTFNGAGGLFEAINNTSLSGHLTVIVQNSVTEPAGVPTFLNSISSCPRGTLPCNCAP
jgi:hypothetical protein